MLFSSMFFLWIFLPLVLIIYFIVPAGARNAVLLAASLFFYAFGEAKYLVLLLAVVAINYAAALLISRRKYAGPILFAGIAANLLILGYYKYFNFFVSLINRAVSRDLIAFRDIALPLGISFFTFQAMSYTIDVYRGKTDVQRNYWKLLLYVSLFPQLIAGPIVRYRDVAEEIDRRTVSTDDFAYGIKRFVFGLAKKVLLSNTLAVYADMVFDHDLKDLSSGLLLLATACYTLQIYYDFSGYSDMAIGIGRMLGFHFNENFDYPYQASSVREFWRRWHISLSTWFREYVYFPLGGSRCSLPRTCLNLGIVFLLTGLWHGASLNFVFWGLFHGAFMLAERLFLGKYLEKNRWRWLNHLYTMAVVMIGWIFFRVSALRTGFWILIRIFSFQSGLFSLANSVNGEELLALAAGIALCGPIQAILPGFKMWTRDDRQVRWTDILLEAILLFFCLMLLVSDTYNPFIYFRF